jgi:hypothetical protein
MSPIAMRQALSPHWSLVLFREHRIRSSVFYTEITLREALRDDLDEIRLGHLARAREYTPNSENHFPETLRSEKAHSRSTSTKADLATVASSGRIEAPNEDSRGAGFETLRGSNLGVSGEAAPAQGETGGARLVDPAENALPTKLL